MRKTMYSVLGTLVFVMTPAFAQTGPTTEGGTTPRGFQQQLGEDQPDRQLGEQREGQQAGQRQQRQQADQTQQDGQQTTRRQTTQQREGQQTTQQRVGQEREGQQTTQRQTQLRDGEQTTRQRTTRQQTTLDQDRQDGATAQVQDRQRRQVQAQDDDQPVTGPAMRASDITGMNVRNHLDEDLGSINDLVIDLRTGQIRYAALASGGILGIGADMHAVPWGAFRLQGVEGDRHLVLNATAEQFENAPGFDTNNWPNMADQQWATTNDAFYVERGIYTARRTDARPRTGVRQTTDQQDVTRQRTRQTDQQDTLRQDTQRQPGARTGTIRQGTTRQDREVQTDVDLGDADANRDQDGAAAPRRTPRATGTPGADTETGARAGARAGARTGAQQGGNVQQQGATDNDN